MYIADLHIHSRYSRATSHDCTPEYLDLWARRKGIHLLGTGDFTHPAWREELKEKLAPAEEGLYILKEEYRIRDGITDDSMVPRFVVTGEISSIYKQGERVRKVHSLILLPGLDDAEQLALRLEQIGNIHSDGRPILGLSCHDLLEITLESSPKSVYVPAHIWTPHFSMFGAFSGFDTIEECFGDLTPHIHALETGLSSDPPMNWRLSALDTYQLISNSDAHSPAKLGREANLLDKDLSYPALAKALETGEGLLGTIEFFPEEGKYHFDGHRKCHLCLSPSEALRYDGKCPVCGRKLTIGVSHRVEELADRAEGYLRPDAKLFESLVPLPEVIAASTGKTAASVKVQKMYQELLGKLGDEFSILRSIPEEEIRLAAGSTIAEGISRLRRGEVGRKPGFDGEYGTIQLFEPWEIDNVDGQISLFLPSAGGSDREIAKRESAVAAEGVAEDACRMEFLRKRERAKPDRGMKEKPEQPGSRSYTLPDRAGGPAGADEESATRPYIAERDVSQVSSEYSLLNSLNAEQRNAAVLPARAIAVTAGPGTGKTGTLTARIAYLLNVRGVKPSEITAVTFTNKAAAELKNRLEKQAVGKRVLRRFNTGTFHSLCLDLLREQGFERTPAAEEMLLELAGDTVKELGLKLSPSDFLRELSLKKSGCGWEAVNRPEAAKSQKMEAAGSGEETPASEAECFQRAAKEYQRRLEAEGACDFDDLLLETLKLLKSEKKKEIRKERFSYLLVDEFQDVNPVQFRLIQAWNRGGKELFVIGDPDQSIYGFRGSDPVCFARLETEYPGLEKITLSRNYRSVPSVLSGAGAVISRNPGLERHLIPAREEGAKIRLIKARSGMAEAIFAAKEINRLVGGIDMLDAQEKRITERLTGFSDIAVLYRTHRQAALLEKCLQKEGIPYLVAGREEYLSDGKVRGTVSFFRYLSDTSDMFSEKLCRRLLWKENGEEFEKAAKRWSEYPVQKKKPAEIVECWIEENGWDTEPNMDMLLKAACLYRDMKEFLHDLSFGKEGDLRRPGRKQYRSDAVTLMTLHAAKGLEFPAVILCGVRKGLIPLEWKEDSEKNGKEKTAGEKAGEEKEPAESTAEEKSGEEKEAVEMQTEREAKRQLLREEERRLFYVGMTRAKDQLILVTGDEESEFLSDLPENCVEREDAEVPKKAEEAKQLSLFDWMN